MPSYNQEKENYKDNHNLPILNLSSDAKLQDWEDVKHPTYLVKLVFYTVVTIII